MNSTHAVRSIALLSVVLAVQAAQAAPATEVSTTRAAAQEKVGRFMVNLKIGPALGAYNSVHLGAIVLELGWSVLPNKDLYLLLPLQFHFTQGGGAVIVPVGLQYDIRLPVPGLYLYPRLSLGYVASFAGDGMGGTATSHFGIVTPEFGIKYVFQGRWNLGGEIFSLPIAFNGAGAALQYRILVSAGLNF